MKVEKFEQFQIWQKSKELTLNIYQLFANSKDYSFKDQIQRASVSIMNNVAEGFERKGKREFKKFLYIAKGSCAEIRSMLYLANDLGYINKSEFDKLFKLSIEISKMLSGLIKSL
jgi:four helix bundle protein